MSCIEISSPIGHALKGLHGSADTGIWPYDENAFSIIRRADIKAVKLLTGQDIDYRVVVRLRQEGVQYIMARILTKAYPDSTQTFLQLVQEEQHSIEKLYAAGIREFEIGNEVNLHSTFVPEGFGSLWHDGAQMAEEWIKVANYLTPLFPDARWCFPAMSPGAAIPDIRYDGVKMLEEAYKSVHKADFIAQHVYWNGVNSTWQSALEEIRQFALKINKPIMISEFSNPNPNISKYDKGREYKLFYEGAKRLPKNVVGLFSYCLSATDPAFKPETWEDGEIVRGLTAA